MKGDWSITDFYDRIQELLKLKSGWLDGDGEPISFDISHLAAFEIDKHLHDCPPHVFPMPSGGLSLEWFKGNDEVVATIEPDFKGTFVSNVESYEADWTMEQEWVRLARNVKNFLK